MKTMISKVINRIYGLGGKDFYADDAEQFFQLAIEAGKKLIK